MWVRHASAREIEVIDDGDIANWTAEHDGYASLGSPAWHRRSVLLDRVSRRIDIIDEIEGAASTFVLPSTWVPMLRYELDESCAMLSWQRCGRRERHGWNCHAASGGACTAVRPNPSSAGTLPAWDAAFPPLASLGCGRCEPGEPLTTRLDSSKLTSRVRLPFPVGPYHRAIRRPIGEVAGSPSGGQMSQQVLDLRRAVQVVRRHRVLVGIVALPWASSSAAPMPHLTRRCSPVPRSSFSRGRCQAWQRRSWSRRVIPCCRPLGPVSVRPCR